MSRYQQGFFKPANPHKYKGDPTNIVYRSSWELSCMQRFDTNPAFIEWSSEETIIPYISPVDNKRHRYFVDFKVKKKCPRTGVVETYLVEVKPKAHTRPPKKRKRITEGYKYEVFRWGVNEAKWNAAVKYCQDRGYKFIILTEDHLNLT